MMDDLEILSELIKEGAHIPAEGNGVITLKGFGSNNLFKITGAPDKTIAIKVDENFLAPTKIFKGEKGECRRADCVLITSTPNKKWIVYIEIKRGNSALANEIIKQLKGARCFIAYCRSVGREFWEQANFLNINEYQERFVGIVNISVNKRPTRHIQSSNKHDKPENFLRINGPAGKLYFKKLINKPS